MRPVLEYGSSTFGTAALTTPQKLEKIQNTGLRIISGGMKSTPINKMERLAGLKILEEQREEKIVVQAGKYKRLQRHPLHTKISELSSYRIKRLSFKKTAREMCAKHFDIMPQGEGEIEPLNATRSGRVHHKILNISTEIPEIQKHKEASEVTKAKALEYLQNNFPSEILCHVYTDGSAKDATGNGGSEVYIKYPDTSSTSHSFALGKLASNFRAELQAIRETINILIERNITHSNMIILSYCLAALQSLQSEARDEVVQIIFRNLGQLQTNNILALQWVSAHCGLFGNEEADRLAKEGVL